MANALGDLDSAAQIRPVLVGLNGIFISADHIAEFRQTTRSLPAAKCYYFYSFFRP
jgi:hypothetical protein